jgi:hypothetical protein
MVTEDQFQDYAVPLGSLAIGLIIVGAVVLAGTSWHGIWPFLGGLLLGAFLWCSANISVPRAFKKRQIARAPRIAREEAAYTAENPTRATRDWMIAEAEELQRKRVRVRSLQKTADRHECFFYWRRRRGTS